MLLPFCRSGKPKNRPSFRQIMMHLDIAANEILRTPEEKYFQTQVRTFKYVFEFHIEFIACQLLSLEENVSSFQFKLCMLLKLKAVFDCYSPYQ